MLVPVLVIVGMTVAAVWEMTAKMRQAAEFDAVVDRVRDRHPDQWASLGCPASFYTGRRPTLAGRIARPMVAAELSSSTPD